MSDESSQEPVGQPAKRGIFAQFNNWISATGAVIAVGALFAFLFLFVLDTTSSDSSPYLGILTFLVAPFFLISGLVFIVSGWLIDKWVLARTGRKRSFLEFSLDFSNPRERKKFAVFVAGATLFLFLSALGSYQTYHFTEGNAFCGEVCHRIMEPEYVTYQQSPHARVACVECHIGEGATWYVKAKIDGLYQVYATIFKKYPTPVDTPIESLRPAQDTCEKCHWPQVFTGSLVRTNERYLSDTENTNFTVQLILDVGGGDPRMGDVGGIHWHTDPANKVEYIALDHDRQDVPWVRLTKANGESSTFVREGFDMETELGEHEVRVMDCIDCHNRPAHVIMGPNDALDRAFSLNRLDTSYPDLKYVAADLLIGEYATTEEAHAAIRDGMREEYGDIGGVGAAISELQDIYDANFFPFMKADWSVYPNNIGHKNFPGCFRCHGGEHYNIETEAPLQAADCNSCHMIIAQGTGDELLKLAPAGLEFAHPDGDVEGFLCSDCHNGGPQ